MFGMPSIRIGRVFGIPIEVNASWLIIFVLISTALATQYFPTTFSAASGVYAIVGIATALLFFASVVLHELTHSLVARSIGIPVRKVTLFLFGGVAQLDREPDSPAREFSMAVAGPAMSFFLAAAFFVLGFAADAFGAQAALIEPLKYLSVINLYIGVFNLLPGFPLDGGRVLRAAVWKMTGDFGKATRWASRAGQLIGYGLASIGLIGVIMGNFGSIWFVVLGWFLATLAESSYRQLAMTSRLHTTTAASIMSTPVVVAPGDIALDQLVEEFFLGGQHSKYPVAIGGMLVGIVTLGRVRSVPREAWPSTRAADVVDAATAGFTVSADTPVDALLERLGTGEDSALLVTRDGVLAGILTRSDVVRALRATSTH